MSSCRCEEKDRVSSGPYFGLSHPTVDCPFHVIACQRCYRYHERGLAAVCHEWNGLVELPEAVALIDLDGTLANFDGSMDAAMRKLASPEELAAGNYYPREQDEEPGYIKERRRLVKRMPGFWRELQVLPLGKLLFDQAVLMKFEVEILTRAPKKNSRAWSEKLEWCWKHLPMEETDVGINLVSKTKHRFRGRLLVDDFPPYVVPWLDKHPEGTVIMHAWPWNADFRHPRVLRVDGEEDYEAAIERMAWVRRQCAP